MLGSPKNPYSSLVIDPVKFHEELRVHCFHCIDDVIKYYFENIEKLKAQYGVLLFLYSVIASKVGQRNRTNVYISSMKKVYKSDTVCIIPGSGSSKIGVGHTRRSNR